MLWEIDIHPAPGQIDRLAQRVAADAAELGIAANLKVSAASGYLIQGRLQQEQAERLARELFVDRVVERAVVGQVGDAHLNQAPLNGATLIHVLPKPGVMDPVAQERSGGDRRFWNAGRRSSHTAKILDRKFGGGKSSASCQQGVGERCDRASGGRSIEIRSIGDRQRV